MSEGTIWSFVVTIVGLLGFILAGRKVWWAWYVNMGCQALWLIFGALTAQYGFIISALVYTVIFTQNAIKWTKERDTAKAPKVTHTTFDEVQVAYEDYKAGRISRDAWSKKLLRWYDKHVTSDEEWPDVP